MTSKMICTFVGLSVLATSAILAYVHFDPPSKGSPHEGLAAHQRAEIVYEARPSVRTQPLNSRAEPAPRPPIPADKSLANRWWVPMSAEEFAASAGRKAEIARQTSEAVSASGDGTQPGRIKAIVGKAQRSFGLSDAEMIGYFDVDGDGVLDDIETAEADAVLAAKMSEFEKVSEASAESASRWYVERLARFDANGDGELDLDESYEAYLNDVETKASWRFHDRYDADQDGLVGQADFEAFLLLYQSKDPSADVDDDGRLTDRDVEAFEVSMNEFEPVNTKRDE